MLETSYFYALPIASGAILLVIAVCIYGGRLVKANFGWSVFCMSGMGLLCIPGIQYVALLVLIYLVFKLSTNTLN